MGNFVAQGIYKLVDTFTTKRQILVIGLPLCGKTAFQFTLMGLPDPRYRLTAYNFCTQQYQDLSMVIIHETATSPHIKPILHYYYPNIMGIIVIIDSNNMNNFL